MDSLLLIKLDIPLVAGPGTVKKKVPLMLLLLPSPGSEKVRRFACDICEKKFYTNHDLRRHHTIHQDSRPFICEVHVMLLLIKYHRHYFNRHFVCTNPMKPIVSLQILVLLNLDNFTHQWDLLGEKGLMHW